MKFIIVDGSDGVGKTTFTKKVVKRLRMKGEKVKRLKFPTKLPSESDYKNKVREVLFYLKDFEKEISNLKDFEGILVCDRSFLTTLAYQGYTEDTQKNIYYDGILALGLSSFFEIPNKIDSVLFVKLTCELEEALQRTEVRNADKTEDQLDRVDKMSQSEKRSMLQKLNARYSDLWQELKKLSRFGLKLFLDQDLPTFSFKSIDTTSLTPDEAVQILEKMTREDQAAS